METLIASAAHCMNNKDCPSFVTSTVTKHGVRRYLVAGDTLASCETSCKVHFILRAATLLLFAYNEPRSRASSKAFCKRSGI